MPSACMGSRLGPPDALLPPHHKLPHLIRMSGRTRTHPRAAPCQVRHRTAIRIQGVGDIRRRGRQLVASEARPGQARLGRGTGHATSMAILTYSDGSCSRDRRCGELRKLNTITAEVASISIMGAAFIIRPESRNHCRNISLALYTAATYKIVAKPLNAARRCAKARFRR